MDVRSVSRVVRVALFAWSCTCACSASTPDHRSQASQPRPAASDAQPAAPVSSSPPAPSASAATPVAAPPPRDPVDVELSALGDALVTPRVSADSKRIALHPGAEGEGERVGLLRIVDVDADRTASSIDFGAADAPERKLARLAEARAALAAQTWSATIAYETEDDDPARRRAFGLGETSPQVARGEGLRVRFDEPTLTVTADDGKVVLRRPFPTWSGRQTVGGQKCVVFADLSRAWGRRVSGVLVVEIRYATTPDFCSVASTTHAVRIPSR